MIAISTLLLCLPGCASRSEFIPEGGTVTVGMPAALSDRERAFIPEVDAALREGGYLPVRHGAGELSLDFRIAAGPINTDTVIELRDGRTVLAEGEGRGSGVPGIGRDKVAERSFQRAVDGFRASLPAAGSTRVPAGVAPVPSGGDPAEMEYVY